MAYVVTNGQHYSDIADAIRAKGVSGTFRPDEMSAAVGQIRTGEEVFYNDKNIGYTRHTVATGTGVASNSQFTGCVNLESIEMPNFVYSPSGGIHDLFGDCTHLKDAILPKCTYIGRKLFSGCTALEQVQIGSIGYPVTGASELTVFSNVAAAITVYVDAVQISDIPASITENAPWGAARATIIYRSSTTGEVIEA